MTIVVLVKQVPDMNAVKIDTSTGAASTSGKAMNSFDAIAVQHALSLREHLGGEIVVVTAGPTMAKDALTRALAMGADRGIHVELNDQAVRDSLDVAGVIAEAIAPLEPDIVLCGQQSDDIETGQVGPQIAELLGAPHVSNVMTVDAEGESLRLQRDTEGGYQQVRTPLPVVIMVTSSAEEPLYPSIKGMMAAKRKSVEKIAAAELGGETRLSWSEPKAPKREMEGILVQGEGAQDAARMLVSWLRENKLIAR